MILFPVFYYCTKVLRFPVKSGNIIFLTPEGEKSSAFISPVQSFIFPKISVSISFRSGSDISRGRE